MCKLCIRVTFTFSRLAGVQLARLREGLEGADSTESTRQRTSTSPRAGFRGVLRLLPSSLRRITPPSPPLNGPSLLVAPSTDPATAVSGICCCLSVRLAPLHGAPSRPTSRNRHGGKKCAPPDRSTWIPDPLSQTPLSASPDCCENGTCVLMRMRSVVVCPADVGCACLSKWPVVPWVIARGNLEGDLNNFLDAGSILNSVRDAPSDCSGVNCMRANEAIGATPADAR